MTRLIASCICHEGNHILLERVGEQITLPSVAVEDDLSIEMALNNYFQGKEWIVAIGSLRYLLEQFINQGKILHLVYLAKVLKKGKLNEFIWKDIYDINLEHTQPKMLFAKLLADKNRWDTSLCTTLVSW